MDFVLSNPPYIREGDFADLAPEIRDHEPRLALDGGHDGLAVHRRLALQTPAFLKRAGCLIVEFGLGQVGRIRNLYGGVPGFEVMEVRPDLAGIPRICAIRAV